MGFVAVAKGRLGVSGRIVHTALGLACLFVWEFYKRGNGYVMPETPQWLHPYGLASLALGAIGVLAWKRPGNVGSPATRLDAAVGAVAMASTLAFSSWDLLDTPRWLVVAGLVLSDVTLGWLYVRWLVALSRQDTSTACSIAIWACAIGALAKIALFSLIPPAALMVLCSLLPLATGLVLAKDPENLPDKTDAGAAEKAGALSCKSMAKVLYRRDNVGMLWAVGACVATFTLVYSIVNMVIKTQFGSLALAYGDEEMMAVSIASRLLELLVCCIVMWWISIRRGTFAFLAMWRILVCFITAALLMVLVLGTSPVIQVFTSPAVMLLTVFLIMMVANVARHSDMNPHAICACGLLFFMLPSYLGRVMVDLSGVHTLEPWLVMPLLGLVTIVTAFCATSYNQGVRNLLADLNGRASDPCDFSSIEQRCIEVGKAWKLSEREVEVMQLLVKGRSKPYIAESLFISENTVRTYTKRIYDKLGIHSKQELMGFVFE